jgi:dTDP-4-dehydrorhamnose reductase
LGDEVTSRVIVTGAGGLLGGAVADLCPGSIPLTHADLDVTDRAAVFARIADAAPTLVVHCAGLTNVDVCEEDPQRALAVNGEGSRHVAEAADAAGADLVAISTDYVFDGTATRPYTEADTPNPVQSYGRSKLAGEEAVRTAAERHYIVRSAWIYGPGGKNFISQLPRLAAEGTPITAVMDQTGSPTYALDLAEAIIRLASTARYGTYHVTNAGVCTFAELCRFALSSARSDATVEEISWRDLSRPAVRPSYTALENASWREAGLPGLRGWQEAVTRFMTGT